MRNNNNSLTIWRKEEEENTFLGLFKILALTEINWQAEEDKKGKKLRILIRDVYFSQTLADELRRRKLILEPMSTTVFRS